LTLSGCSCLPLFIGGVADQKVQFQQLVLRHGL